MQRSEETVLTITDARQRASRLKTFANSYYWPARVQAVEELGKIGPAAIQTISEMLDDPEYFDRSSELLRAIVAAGGKTVGEELNRRLEREVAFWSSTARLYRKLVERGYNAQIAAAESVFTDPGLNL